MQIRHHAAHVQRRALIRLRPGRALPFIRERLRFFAIRRVRRFFAQLPRAISKESIPGMSFAALSKRGHRLSHLPGVWQEVENLPTNLPTSPAIARVAGHFFPGERPVFTPKSGTTGSARMIGNFKIYLRGGFGGGTICQQICQHDVRCRGCRRSLHNCEDVTFSAHV